MKKEGKKYVIRESELKEIIQEMMLMELYNPNDYANMYTKNYKGSVPNLGDTLKGVGNLLGGIPNAIIPDKWKEAVANGDASTKNRILQYILGTLGATAAGTAGADWLPNWTDSKWLGGPGIDTPQNGDAHEVFDVGRAVNWLVQNATPYYRRGQKNCARRIRMALNRGNLTAPWGMGNYADSAKGYIEILPRNGWEKITPQQAGEPGDIIVLDAFPGHPNGHIGMCAGGGQWYAEYKHVKPWGTRETPPANVIHYFRYRNRA